MSASPVKGVATLTLLAMFFLTLPGCTTVSPPAEVPTGARASPSASLGASTPTAVPAPGATAEQSEETGLVIHLLNASRSRSPVDIQLFIDGALVAEGQLVSGHLLPAEEPALSITPHLTYEFPLVPGRHTLRAHSSAGEASFDTTFEISGRHWAILGYEYGAGGEEFEFLFQSEPILFQ